MEILSGTEARRMEPLLSKRVRKALYAPTTGIISPFALITSLAEAAAQNGVRFLFGCEAKRCSAAGKPGTGFRYGGRERKEKRGDTEEPARVVTSKGTITTRFIINTAGDNAARMKAVCVRRIS